MGLEDAGTVALLLKELCLDADGQFSFAGLKEALSLYESMRIRRASYVLDRAIEFGNMQYKRATYPRYDEVKSEVAIKRGVFFHDTMPVLFAGATHDYRKEVEQILRDRPVHLFLVPEEEGQE